MDFSGQYLTYEEYKALGGTLDLTPFNLLEFEARRQIDIRTFNRLKDLESEDIPQEVKLCDYALINSLENYTQTLDTIAGNNGIASENTDGYSISYVGANQINDIVKSKSAELGDIIRNYLLLVIVNGEHLMYCGVE
jgi:hypothetical protein